MQCALFTLILDSSVTVFLATATKFPPLLSLSSLLFSATVRRGS